jgi:hypothetical protein
MCPPSVYAKLSVLADLHRHLGDPPEGSCRTSGSPLRRVLIACSRPGHRRGPRSSAGRGFVEGVGGSAMASATSRSIRFRISVEPYLNGASWQAGTDLAVDNPGQVCL